MPPDDLRQFKANMLADRILEIVKAAMDGVEPLKRPRATIAGMILPYIEDTSAKPADPYRDLINTWSDRFVALHDAFQAATNNHEVAEATHRFLKSMDGSEADLVRQERERLRQQVVDLEARIGQAMLDAALALFKLGLEDQANSLLDGHGVEEIYERDAGHTGFDRTLRYINLGDTYDTTVCHDLDTGEMWIGSWGDWVEQVERDHCQETNTIRCGYCGAFTPHPEGMDWRDVTCESCGHNVSTGVVPVEAGGSDT